LFEAVGVDEIHMGAERLDAVAAGFVHGLPR
jgi:hypothetical protein